jgi:hypothetical protein
MDRGRRIIAFVKSEFTKMSPYERWRLCFQVIQVMITLGVPFIAVWLNKNWN